MLQIFLTLVTFYWLFPPAIVLTRIIYSNSLTEGLEEGSRLHRINTSTTYISTRRKNQLASGKTLLATEVCSNRKFIFFHYLHQTFHELWLKWNIWFWFRCFNDIFCILFICCLQNRRVASALKHHSSRDDKTTTKRMKAAVVATIMPMREKRDVFLLRNHRGVDTAKPSLVALHSLKWCKISYTREFISKRSWHLHSTCNIVYIIKPVKCDTFSLFMADDVNDNMWMRYFGRREREERVHASCIFPLLSKK